MKTRLFLTRAALSLLFALSPTLLWAYYGGDGSQGTPYLISNVNDLTDLANAVNGGTTYSGTFFKLTTDITFDDGTNNFTAIGNSEQHYFAGTFLGDNHVIRGINIDKKTDNYQGLFGNIGSGAIIENVVLTNTYIRGKKYVGGIVGCVKEGNTTITNCHVTSSVEIDGYQDKNPDTNESHGGIVGISHSGCTISNCTSAATISFSHGKKNDSKYFGGLVGNNNSGNLYNNFVLGASISADVTNKGAIIGYGTINGNNITVKNNYYYLII